jgi:hypothetical protein
LLPDVASLFISAHGTTFDSAIAHAGQNPERIGAPPVGYAVSFRNQLAEGLIAAQHEGVVPIWLVFAIQNMLDVFHITRKAAGGALSELRLTAAKTKESLLDYYAYSTNMNSPH